jgi:PAS domain S-box-containing protein
LEYWSRDGKPGGFTVEVIREAAQRAGIPVQFQLGRDLHGNDEDLRTGRVDLIGAGIATSERRRDFWTSDTWWWSEMVAVLPANSAIRDPAGLSVSRLGVPASASELVSENYPHAAVSSEPNARAAAMDACGGRVAAAIIENTYLRELLLGPTPICPGGLRAMDLPLRREFRLVARRGAADEVGRLRAEIDNMTLDGTLAEIASRQLPMSSPQSTRVSELLRRSHDDQIRRFWIMAALLITAVVGGVLLWQYRHQRHLARLNAELEGARESSENYLAQLRTTLDSLSEAVLVCDMNRKIVYWNREAERFGMSEGVTLRELAESCEITGGDGKPVESGRFPLDRILAGEMLRAEEYRIRRPEKPEQILECNGLLARDRNGKAAFAVATIHDVTEARASEAEREKLRHEYAQSQKMESIGRLAGGVAHDFNNLLTVINGYAELLAGEPGLPGGAAQPLQAIREAGDTAARLTRQLLAFSRKQHARQGPLDLCLHVRDMGSLLKRMMGEDVTVEIRACDEPLFVMGDGTQLQQVIMNLAVNAREAMPRGGVLTIETRRGEENMAVLRVSDTGTGIDSQTLPHIFEPFFTTREHGRGTGLGLATVYGIVQQSHGEIDVRSEPGRGAAFEIRLPLIKSAEARPYTDALIPDQRKQHETVLLVEDQEEVRDLVRTMLEQYGYQVLSAESAHKALEIEGATKTIDVLLTDIVMPGMNGSELARAIRERRPTLPVLFMSGYTDGPLDFPDARMLQKPFSPRVLAARLQEVLSSGVSHSSASGRTDIINS